MTLSDRVLACTDLDGLMLLALYFFVALGFIMHDPEEAHCMQDQLCGWEDLACKNVSVTPEGVGER